MVLAAIGPACGARGRRPLGSWADVNVAGGMFVQHVGPQQFARGRLARRREPCSRCWQQLGAGLQLVRLIGIATARGGAGAGGGRAVRVCLSALAGTAA